MHTHIEPSASCGQRLLMYELASPRAEHQVTRYVQKDRSNLDTEWLYMTLDQSALKALAETKP